MPGIVKKKSKQKSQMLVLNTSPSTQNQNQSPFLDKPFNFQTTDSLDKKQSTMASANMEVSGSV